MTHKERMLMAARGEMPDILPFAPRLDLWYQANRMRGTLPAQYKDAESEDEIARAHGWGVHRVILKFAAYGENPIIDRTLGVFRVPTQGLTSDLPENVQRIVRRGGEQIKVEYVTPIGTVRGSFILSEAMKRSGISIPIITEHVIKGPEDYKVLGYIFEHMRVESAPDDYLQWAESAGEDTLSIVYALSAGSPMHHIMKVLMDSTQFYYQHRDYEKQMTRLAEQVGVYFRKVYDVIAKGPAEAYMIGANFDDTITYAPFFRDHIMPWIQEGSEELHNHGKLSVCHTDGENQGLMDYIHESGIDLADSVCPAPMTKVSIGEYYRHWSDRITIFGGIPSNFLLADLSTEKELDNYLDELFKAIAPGTRFILGIADITPPNAVFDRLLRISERVEKDGRLPLEAGSFRPISERQIAEAAQRVTPEQQPDEDGVFKDVKHDILHGKNMEIIGHVNELLEKGINAQHILNKGMLPTMEVIGERFKTGDVFIPEVLLSARAMNEALVVLEPYLSSSSLEAAGRVVMGTVKGDLHDIGKNMVITMLRGVGFGVIDLGMDVHQEEFIKQVKEHDPEILGLSALLTTTMPEMKNVIVAFEQAGLRDKVKIMVGGAPINEKFAKEIGADGYGADAGEAVALAKELLRK